MHSGPHVQLYSLFAADARAYKVAGDAESLPLLEIQQCIQLTWKNIFVIFTLLQQISAAVPQIS